eukprot:10058-Heterococcus_DN1.PRE.3
MSLGDITALQEISDTKGAAGDTSATVSTHDKKRKSSDALKLDDDATPLEKLQAALTYHKEKGTSFEAIASYFLDNVSLNNPSDTAHDTEVDEKHYNITCDTFTAGLHKIGLDALSNAQTTGLFVSLAKEDKTSISMKEFANMCLAIPSTTWKAERARRMRAITELTVSSTAATASHGLDDAIAVSMLLEFKENTTPKRKSTLTNYINNGNTTASAITAAITAARFDGDGASLKVTEVPAESNNSIGDVIYSGELLFWREKETVDVTMFLNESRQALAVCISNDKLSVRYPLIVLDATAIRDAIVHSATIKQDNSIAITTTTTVTTSESGVDNKVDIQVASNDDTDTTSAASSTHGHLSSVAMHSDNSVNAGTAVVASIAADADTTLVKEARISVSLGDKPHQAMIQYILTRLKLVPNALTAATPTSNDGDIMSNVISAAAAVASSANNMSTGKTDKSKAALRSSLPLPAIDSNNNVSAADGSASSTNADSKKKSASISSSPSTTPTTSNLKNDWKSPGTKVAVEPVKVGSASIAAAPTTSSSRKSSVSAATATGITFTPKPPVPNTIGIKRSPRQSITTTLTTSDATVVNNANKRVLVATVTTTISSAATPAYDYDGVYTLDTSRVPFVAQLCDDMWDTLIHNNDSSQSATSRPLFEDEHIKLEAALIKLKRISSKAVQASFKRKSDDIDHGIKTRYV